MPSLPRSFRQVFERPACLLRELHTVGRTRVTQARVPGLAGHTHAGVYEIFLIERGDARWWVEDELHQLAAGDIYLNRPGERHGSLGPSLRPCAYCWLQLATPRRCLPGLSLQQSRRIIRAMDDRRVRSFPATPAMREHFIKLWELHAAPGPDAALRAGAHLHLLLAEFADEMEKYVRPRHVQTFAMHGVLRRIDADPGGAHSNPALAALAGLGLTQFNERFFAETGFTPADYVRRRRVEHAKERLRESDISITTLAADLGFSSSQHFATVFRNFEGVKPSEFRRQLLRESWLNYPPRAASSSE